MTINSNFIARATIERVVREIVRTKVGDNFDVTSPIDPTPKIVVSISARHCHLTDKQVETLFGPGHTLTPSRPLYQEGFFAAEETVMVVGPRRRMLPQVRVLGPTRKQGQVELARTDAISLGIDVPVRASGNIGGTPGCVLVGPHGVVELTEGVIRAERHVHINWTDAAHFGVSNGDRMSLRIVSGTCSMVMQDLLVRADETSKLEVHIDTDEGNACDLDHASQIELLRPDQSCQCQTQEGTGKSEG